MFQVLTIEQRVRAPAAANDRLVLAWELRCRSRLRATLESGDEVGLFLPRGEALRDGDLLLASDGRVVEVVAARERLMEARSTDPLLIARAAYHLGNRHAPVQAGEGWLRFPADHVLRDMLVGLGLAVEELDAPFDPEPGAYAHGHVHGVTGEGAKIHRFGAQP